MWMGIWVHPYAVLHVQVEVSFRENGVCSAVIWCGTLFQLERDRR